MKKYIKPVQQIYNVSACCMAAGSPIDLYDENEAGNSQDVKEEKGNFFWN